MKLLDKLKNAFFEEVEEEEDDTIEIPKTYAKKVEVPKKKSSFFKKDEDEEDDDDDDDIFKDDVKEKKEEKKINHVKIEDHSDFNETQEIPVAKEEVEVPKVVPMVFDEEDFETDIKEDFSKSFIEDDDTPLPYQEVKKIENEKIYPAKEEEKNERNHDYISSMRDSNNSFATFTRTTYTKTTTTTFKPSPIISPIYGILDKNYRKEEVVAKRETRISTSSYKKPDLDSVRNRAFASIDEEKEVTKPKALMDKKKENNHNVYDVNNTKPQVSKVTLADADEYYNDLGLAYNVDYSDASRNNTRSSKYNVKDKKNDRKPVDDNLFDLIDSMYSREE